jgi:hypothetical protein
VRRQELIPVNIPSAVHSTADITAMTL